MGKVHFLPPTEGKFAKARESLNKHVLDPDRGSEGKWQSLIENFPDIILTVTGDGTITFMLFPPKSERKIIVLSSGFLDKKLFSNKD